MALCCGGSPALCHLIESHGANKVSFMRNACWAISFLVNFLFWLLPNLFVGGWSVSEVALWFGFLSNFLIMPGVLLWRESETISALPRQGIYNQVVPNKNTNTCLISSSWPGFLFWQAGETSGGWVLPWGKAGDSHIQALKTANPHSTSTNMNRFFGWEYTW